MSGGRLLNSVEGGEIAAPMHGVGMSANSDMT